MSRPLHHPAVLLVALALAAAPAAPATDEAPPERLAAVTRLAEEALREGEWELAESRLREALHEGLLRVGALAAAEDDGPGAFEAFEEAERAVAEPREARLELALADVREGRPEAAIRRLRALASRNPADGLARRLLAQVLVLEGRTGEAVQELEEALAAAPEDAELLYALGVGRLRLGEDVAAEAAFDELVRRRPLPATRVLIGRTYLDHERVDRALRALEAALAEDPRARRAHYYLAKLDLSRLGYDGLESAVEHLRSEIEAYPGDPLANLHLGIALGELRRCDEATAPLEQAAGHPLTALDAERFLGKCHLAARRDAEARDALVRALAAAGGRTRPRQLESIHYQLGVAFRRLGDARAEEHFAAAERLSGELVAAERDGLAAFFEDRPEEAPPELLALSSARVEPLRGLDPAVRAELGRAAARSVARSYSNLATLLARREEPARATELFAAAARHDPTLPDLDRNLGLTAFAAGRHAVAAPALERALAAAPGELDLRRRLALARLELGEPAAAVELLADDPGRADDPRLQYAYALALVRGERSAEAEAAFAELLARHPQWPELHVLLGQARAREGDFPGAVEALGRALALDPTVAEAHATLGEIRLRQGEIERAIESLRAELASHPQAVGARHQLAIALELADRPDEALAELDRLLRRDPGHADARYLVGKILLEEGRAAEARAHLEAARARAPDDPNIHYQLGLALRRLGETEAAERSFERYRVTKAAEREAGS